MQEAACHFLSHQGDSVDEEQKLQVYIQLQDYPGLKSYSKCDNASAIFQEGIAEALNGLKEVIIWQDVVWMFGNTEY